MVQLKEKTLEELKKMASKKKIEGRSKMNKAQLVRALSKSKKMTGGALTDEEISMLEQRNLSRNPMKLDYRGDHGDIIRIQVNRHIDFRPTIDIHYKEHDTGPLIILGTSSMNLRIENRNGIDYFVE